MFISDALLRKLDTPGPRYTSYPTADRFHEAFGASDYQAALQLRGSTSSSDPLSVYVHVPFCESVCYYCACNKIVTRKHDRVFSYLDALRTEIALNRILLGGKQQVSQLHFGGGTPTFLTDDELASLMRALGSAFMLRPNAEVSIEVDPRTASPARLQALADMGFNRLSFGIQDFDPAVQQAVHRVQPYDMVRDLMHAAREIGFASINADLIYGLPLQTPESFARTVTQVAALRPDRIALYAYAHLPERFKPQRRIHTHQLPPADARLQMLGGAIEGFLGHGYSYIGMDHFALPTDSLAIAKRQGRLHRNFQGYTTQPDNDLIALGVSAIGRVGATYSQNAKTLDEYYAALHRGELPVVRGYTLTRDDALRRDIIMAVMCQGCVDFDEIETAHRIDFGETFARELERLEAFEEQGLVEVINRTLQVTPLGWYFVRAVAMVFDRHLQSSRAHTNFSRVV
jgi:oxygen-independent coproporphyrinogen III oxidase